MSDGYREFGLLQRREGVSGGMVCLRDSGILIEFLADLFTAGMSVDDIARNYRRPSDEIEAALRFVLLARGSNLSEKRAFRVVERHIPLLRSQRTHAPARKAAAVRRRRKQAV